MTIETDLVAVLDPLVSGRVFPDVAPFDTPRPYVTYQFIGGTPVSYLDGTAPDLANALIQINAWADSRLGANALARAIEAALRNAAAFTAVPAGQPLGNHDPLLERYGTLQDFTVWHPA